MILIITLIYKENSLLVIVIDIKNLISLKEEEKMVKHDECPICNKEIKRLKHTTVCACGVKIKVTKALKKY